MWQLPQRFDTLYIAGIFQNVSLHIVNPLVRLFIYHCFGLLGKPWASGPDPLPKQADVKVVGCY